MSCLIAAGFMNKEFNRSRCLQPIGGSRSCGGGDHPGSKHMGKKDGVTIRLQKQEGRVEEENLS